MAKKSPGKSAESGATTTAPPKPTPAPQWPIRQIPLAKIKVPKNYRSPKATAPQQDAMAESVGQVGLLQEIGVRPQGDNYELIYGLKRIGGAERSGLTEVPARIMDLDNDTARLVHITENLIRTEASRAEKKEMLQEWRNLWNKIQKERAKENGGTAKKTGRGHKGFVQTAAEATGTSKSAVRRDLRIADNYEPDDLILCEKKGISDNTLLELLDLVPDYHARNRILVEILSGSTIAEALATEGIAYEVAKATETAQDATEAVEAREAAEAEETPLEATGELQEAPGEPRILIEEKFLRELDLDDAHGNKSLLASLKEVRDGDVQQYQEQAIQYLRQKPARDKLHFSVLNLVKEHGDLPPGPYTDLLLRYLYAGHPRTWSLCGKCSGRGCQSCKYGGFSIPKSDNAQREL